MSELSTNADPLLSVIIPLKDERPSIAPLVQEIRQSLAPLEMPYEILLVDDGSEDGSWDVVEKLAGEDSRITGLRFRRNCGQTAALSAGFDYSTGEIIIPIDADGQNDPADIPQLLSKLNEGYDVVSGWRRRRKDSALSRRLPSYIANKLISLVSGVKLHDYGCTLKAYRRDVVKDVRLYGEMHRFIPIYASWQGARTAEIEVNHRPRVHGRSKYGIARTFKVLLDLIVVKFLSDFLHKPIYIFGGLGMVLCLAGFLSGLAAVWFKFFGGKDFVETPLPLLMILLMAIGANTILCGLLAEISVRTYFEAQQKKTYHVGEVINAEKPEPVSRIPGPGVKL